MIKKLFLICFLLITLNSYENFSKKNIQKKEDFLFNKLERNKFLLKFNNYLLKYSLFNKNLNVNFDFSLMEQNNNKMNIRNKMKNFLNLIKRTFKIKITTRINKKKFLNFFINKGMNKNKNFKFEYIYKF